MIPFDVAEFNYILFLGMQFYEKYIQNIILQDLTMKLKHSFNDQPTIVSLTTLIRLNFPYFFCLSNKFKRPKIVEPNTVQNSRFPLKISKTLLLETGINEPVFAEMLQTHSVTKK